MEVLVDLFLLLGLSLVVLDCRYNLVCSPCLALGLGHKG